MAGFNGRLAVPPPDKLWCTGHPSSPQHFIVDFFDFYRKPHYHLPQLLYCRYVFLRIRRLYRNVVDNVSKIYENSVIKKKKIRIFNRHNIGKKKIVSPSDTFGRDYKNTLLISHISVTLFYIFILKSSRGGVFFFGGGGSVF